MDLFQAVRKRASVRSFAPGEVPRDHIMEILDAARRAPSGYNYQPCEFIVVTDRDILAQLGRIQDCIAEAPLAIAVVVEPCKYWKEDSAAAIENILLAATALGYGSLWVEGYVLAQEPLAKSILGVPEHLRLIAIVPIGRPASPPRQADKKPLAQVVHWDRYGRRSVE